MMRRTVLLSVLSGLVAGVALAQEPRLPPEVPFVPTPDDVVTKMLDMANVTKKDTVYDLGSGDGRIVIAAAKRGARAVGVDIDPERIKESTENARKAGVTDRVKFINGDLFNTDLTDATVVTLYLLPSVNQRLKPKLLRELPAGARIVSHSFDMGSWEPEETAVVNGSTVYKWVVPPREQAEKMAREAEKDLQR